MRIESQTLPACCQNATAAEAAVVEEMQGAGEKQRSARKDKAAARADKLQEMRQITKKLRKIADKTRSSGLFDFGVALASMAIKARGIEGSQVSTKADIAASLVSAGQHINPYSQQVKALDAQKSVHDVRRERASGAEEIAKDAASEAQRLADASLQRLETMQRIQHEGQLAILRG